MGRGGVGILQPSWQVLNCHVGQVRMDPGAGACPTPDKGKCLTQACLWRLGTSLFLEPAGVEHRGGVHQPGAGAVQI